MRLTKIDTNAFRYVDSFHAKFFNPYSASQWKTIKEDQSAIIQLVEFFGIKTYLEIGTWKGYTSLCVWLHPNIVRVKCIDIHKGMGVKFEHRYNELLPKDEVGEYFKNTFVHLQFADTMTYPRGCEQHDLILIDACHDDEHVKNDTELAMSMNPKIIVWHDYNSEPGVTKYLNELESKGAPIDIFEGSLCAAMPCQNLRR